MCDVPLHLCKLSSKTNTKANAVVRDIHCAVGKVRALGKKAALGKKGRLNSLSSQPSQSRVYKWKRTGTEARFEPMVTRAMLLTFHCVGKAPPKMLDNG